MNQVFYNFNYLIHSKKLIKEHASLRKTVDILTQQLVGYKEIETENSRLRKMLEFKERSPLKFKAAGIIGRDSSNLSDTIMIDQGTSAGVKKETVVVAEAGLIGHVIEASSGISRVMLITDANSRVSAVVSRSRQMGVVYGTSTAVCELRYLSLDADVKPGDEVMTSGFSQIYPKGLLIGAVIKVEKEPTGLSLIALLKPSVDISATEEVLCIE
ncbi:MAG: rod shape-determining protein MreC [Candidatus Omnitrophica bacterium]|nr:rod shape-determining protein MreC [Candidatus Omnitrophota bacterium]